MTGPAGGRRRRLILHPPVFLLLVGLVLVVAAVKLWGPMCRARQQQEVLARLRTDRATQQEEQRQLQQYKRGQASDAGQESAARRDGYIRDGDRRLVFVKEKQKKEGGK
jgi:hypothetical protein